VSKPIDPKLAELARAVQESAALGLVHLTETLNKLMEFYCLNIPGGDTEVMRLGIQNHVRVFRGFAAMMYGEDKASQAIVGITVLAWAQHYLQGTAEQEVPGVPKLIV